MHINNTCPKCGSHTRCKCMNCNPPETNYLCDECFNKLVDRIRDSIIEQTQPKITPGKSATPGKPGELGEPFDINRQPEKTMVWLCGQTTEFGWQLQGIFFTKDKAINACKDKYYFIVSIEADKEFPQETKRFEDLDSFEIPLKDKEEE